MILSLIVAMDCNRLIGRENGLPWHLSDDLKRFKAITMGKPIIMGRGTFESIGRPLPGRRNIVVSRNPDFSAAGCECAGDLSQAVSLASNADEAIIIGGAQIYRQALPLVQRMYLTVIDHAFTGDAWFPEYNQSDWELKVLETHQFNNGEPGFSYRFIEAQRKPQINIS